MADDSFQEKTETATPKKRQKTREEGQVARSVEVSSVFVILTGVLVLYFLGGVSYERLTAVLRSGLTFEEVPHMDLVFCMDLAWTTMTQFLLFVLPVFLAIFAMALITNFLQVGFVVSYKAIAPKLSKISIIKGFGRLFSMRSVFEAVKATLKLIIIGVVSYYIVKGELTNLGNLYDNSVAFILLFMLKISFKIFFWVIMVMVVVALLDYLYQKWRFEEQIKMTKQEIKDEFKQAEGDPQVKSRIKTLQQQASRKRMMQDIPKADVVVTNPTHLALAIRYDAATMTAPQIVAKGAGLIAQRIKDIAKENQVPVVENKELAQKLYKIVDIGDEVPEALFGPVAELLAYVYRLKGKSAG